MKLRLLIHHRCSLAILALLLSAGDVSSITRRDDVLDVEYTTLAADPLYESSGFYDYPDGRTRCTGNLIHPEWVLTAGHCVPDNNNPLTVIFFSLGPSSSNLSVTVGADSWVRHPDLDNNNIQNGDDFGLVKLLQPVLDVTPARLYRNTNEQTRTATIVGYGYPGTGSAGAVSTSLYTKRAAENRIDRIGTNSGFSWSNELILADFDNPTNPSDSKWNPTTPTAQEGMIATVDSGSGWFFTDNGINYLAGVSSFKHDPNDAWIGQIRSEYGEIFAGGRVSQDLTWIDDNHDNTVFWDVASGDWGNNGNWFGGDEPGSTNAAVISSGIATVSSAGEVADFVFVENTGQLHLNNQLAVTNLMVKRNGLLTIGATTAAVTLSGSYNQQLDGRLQLDIQGTTVGSQYDRLTVSDTATLEGNLELLVNVGSGSYADPVVRGQQDLFSLLATTTLGGTFDSVDYDGSNLEAGVNYVGSNQNSDDGLFRVLQYSATTVELTNYLASDGDVNGDTVVDLDDFSIIQQNLFTSSTNWFTGDLDGNGLTDVRDFNKWNEHKMVGIATPPLFGLVPEPVSGMLLLIGAAIVYWQRRFGCR